MKFVLEDAAATRAFGVRLASLLRAGDVVLLVGELGAGKTTLTQGIGEGLGVRGTVVSPTFIIAREHPPTGDGPPLIHVDAYRLASLAELDDLDLDASVDDSVTIVEWGEDIAEPLAESHLVVRLDRGRGRRGDDPVLGPREAEVSGRGPRWSREDFERLGGAVR